MYLLLQCVEVAPGRSRLDVGYRVGTLDVSANIP